MRAIGQFIVRVAELLEAEGRAAKRNTFELAGAIVLLVGAGVIALAALGFFVAAIFMLLRGPLTSPGAAAVIGLVLAVGAWACLAFAGRLRNGKT